LKSGPCQCGATEDGDFDDDLTEATGRVYAELLERERIGFTRKPLRRPAGDTSP